MKSQSKSINILIIRPSSIGDIVMASPMLGILRKAYPDARITWLVDPGLTDLLEDNPYVHKILLWKKAQWKGLLKRKRFVQLAREIYSFRKELHGYGFDLALDAQGLFRSRFLAWLSGANVRMGFESKEPGKFFMTRIISKGPSNKQMGSEYMFMMQELGTRPADFSNCIVVSPKFRDSALRKLGHMGINGNYVALFPFTTRPQKHWFAERWGELAITIKEKFGLRSLVLGGRSDSEKAGHLEKMASGAVISVAGKMGLGESMAIVEQSSLGIGVDTGLTHLSIAFNRPSVALFGATCPYLYTGNKRAFVLYKKQPCSPCKRSPICKGEFTCMREIKVNDVLNIIDQNRLIQGSS